MNRSKNLYKCILAACRCGQLFLVQERLMKTLHVHATLNKDLKFFKEGGLPCTTGEKLSGDSSAAD